jgi:hypothetical protein
MRYLIPLVVLSILILVIPACATDNTELWKNAASAYDQGNYQMAIDNYSKLLERGFVSPDLYYNLGNSYFKSHELGQAIWSYRRALALDPGFKQAKSNLAYVRTFNTDQIATQRRGFILDIWDFLSGLLTANGYLMLLMTAWWLFTIILIWKIIKLNGSTWPYYLLIVPLIVVIFSTASAARRINEDRLTHWGVLTQESADIREGPGEEFNKVEVGHEGLEFKILGIRESSYLIELENGVKGWVDKKAVLEI